MKNPISESIKAVQHDPEYTLHRYFARRPHNVINNLISYYTLQKGSLIYDPFGGGGTMLYESLVLGNRAITCDTSDLACFIIEQEALMSSVDIDVLTAYINELMKRVASAFSKIYSFEGKEVYWLEWSTYTKCPECKNDVKLTPYNTQGSGKYKCLHCGKEFKPIGVNVENVVPVEICLMDNGSMEAGVPSGQTKVTADESVLLQYYSDLCNGIAKQGLEESMVPKTRIPDCNLQRESALHKKGIHYFEQFIPKASRAIITFIGNDIMRSNLTDSDKKHLLFVLSASLRYCSRFSSLNQAWRGDRPMEWAKSNFWTPYTYVEVNPIIAFYERWKSYVVSVKSSKTKFTLPPKEGNCHEVIAGEKQFAVLNQSSEEVADLPDECIDLVITDPPYGSYLHYGELSSFWTTWLSKFLPEIKPIPDRTSEAVPARKKGYPGWKDFGEYEAILSKAFMEAYRVLKDESYCVVTFNNKEPEAWIAFLRAVKKAGFILPKDGIIFQDGVEAYKKTIDSRRGGAIFGDFVYSFQKHKGQTPIVENDNISWDQNLDNSLKKLSKETESISNVEMYTLLYLKLLPELYQEINVDDRHTNYLQNLSFKNFESKIQEYYTYTDGIWKRNATLQ